MEKSEFIKMMNSRAKVKARPEGKPSGTEARPDADTSGTATGDCLDVIRARFNADTKEKQHHTAHEEEMQMRIVRLMGEIYPQYADLLVHNANEFHGTMRQGARRKRLGVRKGFPDFSFFLPSKYYHGLFIELKYGKNGQSKEQKEYQKRLESVGYQYVVCRGEDEFIRGMNQYILMGRWGFRADNYLSMADEE